MRLQIKLSFPFRSSTKWFSCQQLVGKIPETTNTSFCNHSLQLDSLKRRLFKRIKLRDRVGMGVTRSLEQEKLKLDIAPIRSTNFHYEHLLYCKSSTQMILHAMQLWDVNRKCLSCNKHASIFILLLWNVFLPTDNTGILGGETWQSLFLKRTVHLIISKTKHWS